MEVINSSNVNSDIIEKLLALDALVYPEDQQGDFESVWERYKKNKDTYTIVFSKDKLVGYFCAFPIKNELYDKIKKEGILFDATISAEKIERYEKGEEFNLYLISVVIDPDFQGSTTLKYLLQGFADQIDRQKKQGIKFNHILASAVTKKGCKLLQSLGFETIYKVSDDIFIMETKVETMINIIRTRLEEKINN